MPFALKKQCRQPANGRAIRTIHHYVIHGTSTKGVAVYCKVCSNYHPQTGAFIEWKFTSFTRK